MKQLRSFLKEKKVLLITVGIFCFLTFSIIMLFFSLDALFRNQIINVNVDDVGHSRGLLTVSFSYNRDKITERYTNIALYTSSLTIKSVQKAYQGKFYTYLKKLIYQEIIIWTTVVFLCMFFLLLPVYDKIKYRNKMRLMMKAIKK